MRAGQFVGRTAAVATGRALAGATQLVGAVVLVRLLPAGEWETVALLLSIYVAAIGIGALNLHQAFLYFHGRHPGRRRRLARQTTGLMLLAGAAAALIVLALAWLVDARYDIAPHLPWLALAVLFEMPTVAGAQMLIAHGRPAAAGLYDGGLAALQGLAIVGPAVMGWGARGIVQGLCAYAVARLLLFLVVMSALFPADLDPRPPRGFLREQLLYTLPLGLAVAASVLNRSIDKWIVAALDPASFGVFAVAAQEVPLVGVVAYAAGNVLATRIVEAFMDGDGRRAAGYFRAQVGFVSCFVVPAAVALVLLAPDLVTLLFTEEYRAAALPFQIYSCVLLHRVAEYGLFLRAAGRTRALWAASIVLLVANAALCWPLTAWLGMTGAALGTLLANALAWFYVLHAIAVVTGVPLRRLFPWRTYLSILAVCAAVAATIAALPPMRSGAAANLSRDALLYGGMVTALLFTLVRCRIFDIPSLNSHEEFTRSP